MPYGISYSDGPQLSDKSALAADKKKKKTKIKRSGQTQGSGGELANLLGQRVAAGRDRLRKQVAKGGGLGPPAIFFEVAAYRWSCVVSCERSIRKFIQRSRISDVPLGK